MLTLLAANPQNSQTHSNNSLNCLSVFDHFVGLEPKGLKLLMHFRLEKPKCMQHLRL